MLDNSTKLVETLQFSFSSDNIDGHFT